MKIIKKYKCSLCTASYKKVKCLVEDEISGIMICNNCIVLLVQRLNDFLNRKEK